MTFMSRILKLWHYWHLEPNNSLLQGAVLSIEDILTISLTSAYQIVIAPSSRWWQPKMSPDIAKCPLGETQPRLRSTGLKADRCEFRGSACWVVGLLLVCANVYIYMKRSYNFLQYCFLLKFREYYSFHTLPRISLYCKYSIKINTGSMII